MDSDTVKRKDEWRELFNFIGGGKPGLRELPGTYSEKDLERISQLDVKYSNLRLFAPGKRNKADIYRRIPAREKRRLTMELKERIDLLKSRVKMVKKEVEQLKIWVMGSVHFGRQLKAARKQGSKEELERKLDGKVRELGVWEGKLAVLLLERDRVEKNRVNIERKVGGGGGKTERQQRLLARAAVNGELIDNGDFSNGVKTLTINREEAPLVDVTDITKWERWGWGEKGGVRVMGGGKVKVLDALVIARVNGLVEPLYGERLREVNKGKCKEKGIGQRGGRRTGDFSNLQLLLVGAEHDKTRLLALVEDVMKSLDENDGSLSGFPYMEVGQRHGLRWQEVREFMEKYLGPVVKQRLGEVL